MRGLKIFQVRQSRLIRGGLIEGGGLHAKNRKNLSHGFPGKQGRHTERERQRQTKTIYKDKIFLR